ncbi:MAG: hypothetical protein A2138_17665 [Deltaproteobacteria bacterium RBG_16_71_12]|nr:MAG: hypothetical protein A2138_17665 [Deltaproteobacteria bacterium RBG_16_71_12]
MPTVLFSLSSQVSRRIQAAKVMPAPSKTKAPPAAGFAISSQSSRAKKTAPARRPSSPSELPTGVFSKKVVVCIAGDWSDSSVPGVSGTAGGWSSGNSSESSERSRSSSGKGALSGGAPTAGRPTPKGAGSVRRTERSSRSASPRSSTGDSQAATRSPVCMVRPPPAASVARWRPASSSAASSAR